MFVEFNHLPGLEVKLLLNIYSLTKAKSEALINIYSLHKQNIKSCNAKRQQNKNINLISRERTLYVQHTIFVHFFAIVLHDYHVKLPKTS